LSARSQFEQAEHHLPFASNLGSRIPQPFLQQTLFFQTARFARFKGLPVEHAVHVGINEAVGSFLDGRELHPDLGSTVDVKLSIVLIKVRQSVSDTSSGFLS
jgi:hypothetical protein